MNGFQIIQSNFAVELDGTEPKEIQQDRGGFFARLFDPDPTIPLWQKTRTVIIQVPRYKPVIYRILDKLIVHPSMMPEIKRLTENEKTFKW